MRAVYFILAATLALVRADDYQDWECPGMPCFIVNYFETRPYDDIKQTCTSISSMTPCNKYDEPIHPRKRPSGFDALATPRSVTITIDVTDADH
mmetsp:Transcript_11745/g.27223  ORF Transcript_11745/g.27223 Transcript_11745/m.27223 type:complete len:94 (+) Transcript_11745:67-348(+)